MPRVACIIAAKLSCSSAELVDWESAVGGCSGQFRGFAGLEYLERLKWVGERTSADFSDYFWTVGNICRLRGCIIFAHCYEKLFYLG
jgi:hypothetical protein